MMRAIVYSLTVASIVAFAGVSTQAAHDQYQKAEGHLKFIAARR